ncbi:toxin-antitoxin system YwqK family antitoxin [Algoriphagus pacificus]|uniref:Toxin-antitoxin system YwqK family antitoxin n=1 Tax=Algoriphagus pacificus TaxID=2811234 RepID=A0ABS3C9L0_9BACT|nr:toxin-antitoxin system YwqK family antitoxin [Algoriphagus pacificus]MBN7813793.1 toxin-antitoxin system YwqK family antitoxin [Algoriphagus pacificus]
MLNIVFSIALSLFSITEENPSYFYFGSVNLIGVGNLEDGKKSGEWKVYSKKVPQETQESIFDPADPQLFEKEFNQEFPLFVINFSDDLPEGIFQENYPSGSIKILAIFENGELENDFKEFYENGEIKYTGQLAAGERIGEWIEYFESGQVKSKTSYSEGLVDGPAFFYTPEGTLITKIFYSGGEIDGLYEAYFPDGELKEQGAFKNGIPTGEWKSYDADRKIQFQGSFIEGLPSGTWLEQMKIIPDYFRKGNYQKGLKEGEWIVSDATGRQIQTENYKAGKLISVTAQQQGNWLKDPNLVKKGNGQMTFFDEQGFVIAKGKVSKGEITGRWSYYYPNSDRLSSSGRIEGSEKIGTWNFYSFDGELIDQMEFKPAPKSEAGFRNANSSRTKIFGDANHDSLESAYQKFNPFIQKYYN